MELTDTAMLDAYCRGSAAALSDLVRRHAGLVYAAACRQTRDATLAEDVTQAVFVVLMRRARSLGSRGTIAGWLLVVTRHVASTALRARGRRDRHERAAARDEAILMPEQLMADELAESLDQALSRLRGSDRDAVALRYLQNQSFAEVGRLLGVSEEAARKRVARGLERLKTVFTRDQLTLTAALPAAIEALSGALAPPALVDRICEFPSRPPAPAVAALAQGTSRMLAIQSASSALLITLLAIGLISCVAVFAQPSPDPRSLPTRASANVPEVASLALHLRVSDIEANIAWFEKIGFRPIWTDTPAADGTIQRASVRSGVVSIRLDRGTPTVASTDDPGIAYFYLDGGEAALQRLRDDVSARGVNASELYDSIRLRQFDVTTPDGHRFGFFTSP